MATADADAVRQAEEDLNLGGAATVLLVEDDPLVLDATCQMLTRQGYLVRTATGVGEALLAFDEGSPPSLLISDINLSGQRCGLELARLVSERWPQVRQLIVSGEKRPSKDEYPAGALFLTKPYPQEALLQLVRTADW